MGHKSVFFVIVSRLFLFMAGIFIVTLPAAATEGQWVKNFGKTYPSCYESIIRTQEGDYLLSYLEPHDAGLSEAVVMKISGSGEVLLKKSFGNEWGALIALAPTSDGGFIAFGGNNGFWAVKLDRSLEIEWQKIYRGGSDEIGFAVKQTRDGGYIGCGYTRSFVVGNAHDYWVVKLNASGDILWQKDFGGSFSEDAHCLLETDDNSFLVAGSSGTYAGGNNDVLILKLDQAGNIIWQKAYGVPEANEYAFSMDKTLDGNYVLAGEISGFGDPGYGAWVFKFTGSGDILWQKVYGYASQINSIRQNPDGTFYIAGKDYLSIVSKLAGDGSVLWSRPASENLGSATSVETTPDGGCIASVWEYPDRMNVVKIGADGEIPYCSLNRDYHLSAQDTHVVPIEVDVGVADGEGIAYPTTAVGSVEEGVANPVCPLYPPVVSSMKKLGDPFRIAVSGSNFLDGIDVYINGDLLYGGVAYKGKTKLILKGGASLKTKVPKNKPKIFTFCNPDGGTADVQWQWP